MNKKILIIAGEPSSDMHGCSLITAMLAESPQIQFYGLGGELMEQAGCRLYHKIGKLSVIGFAEVISKLPSYKRLFKDFTEKLDSERPDLVILIDYPGFNIRFAKEAKKRQIPVIYYISPQVWAWGEARIKTIKLVVDKMLVFFEFEKRLYQQHGIDACFVGHPLVESAKPSMSKEQAMKNFGLNPNQKIIALLPGSRQSEVKRVLPIMLKSSQLIAKHAEEVQFILIKSPIVEKNIYENILKSSLRAERSGGFVKIIDKDRYDAVNCCDLALVASGTATLEVAMLEKPMVVVYKVNFLTWLIARILIRIPFIGLVNVVAEKKIIPEFIQFQARPEKIAIECINILNSPARIALIESQLAEVKKKLGPAGASSNAAKEIIAFLSTC